jgi:hypothetical protein
VQKSAQAELITREIARDYERMRPVLERQKYTVDALQVLSLLQQARSNRNFSFVLFADQQSYFSSAPFPFTNAAPALTNEPAAADLPAPPGASGSKYGFVAELFLPEEGESSRRTLTYLVDSLKQSPLLRKVDSMPAYRQRILVDPKLANPEHHFALEMELAENRYQRGLLNPERSPDPASDQHKAAPRTFKERADLPELSTAPESP